MENRVETATAPTSRATTERRPRERGFTLIEIVVVVAIIAIAAVIAIPNIGAGARQREVRRTLQTFVSTVRRASSVAVFQRKPVELRIHVKEGTYSVVVPSTNDDEADVESESRRGARTRGGRVVGRAHDEETGAEGGRGAAHTVQLPEMASFGDVEGGRDLDDEGIVFDFLPNGSSSGGLVELMFETSRGRPESFRLVINPLVSAISFEGDE
jgi:type II secretion system protein H